MLTEERKKRILSLVNEGGSVSVQRLMEALQASESTVRRDLTELDRKGLLVKVHGGAMASSKAVTEEYFVAEREVINHEKKTQIASYAASLITPEDVVFLDAGTTTGLMIDYLNCTDVLFITNAIAHARKLCNKGFQVYMPGGVVKTRTEALIGAQTCQYLMKCHFTKGFFGANGVTLTDGLTTPDMQEAAVKEMAVQRTRTRYALCDSSKFGRISSVTFADFSAVTVLTDADAPANYRTCENVVLCPGGGRNQTGN